MYVCLLNFHTKSAEWILDEIGTQTVCNQDE